MVSQQIIALIRASQKGKINKDADFRKLLITYFNLEQIGKFALGRYWKLATIAEREEYSKLFESVTVKTYASQFDEYTNEDLQVTGARANTENGITVLSRVLRSGHPPLNVNWEISILKDGHMKIEDLIVNGVSMRITQRSEYMSVIQQHQGKVAGLINGLREQLKRLNAES
ncbi:MAG: ABC transporter substrate-binding protein [Alphaproteobacteria bacterium]|nr:ABC transporter substrate-binding protein [Alphaproteobacteria bacterium]